MPMDRSKYPVNWDEIALRIKATAGWRCVRCGTFCYEPGEAVVNRQWVLTVHHKDHNPQNCGDDNLEALCSPCHLKEEALYRNRLKVYRQKRAGQLSMAL